MRGASDLDVEKYYMAICSIAITQYAVVFADDSAPTR